MLKSENENRKICEMYTCYYFEMYKMYIYYYFEMYEMYICYYFEMYEMFRDRLETKR